MARQNGGERTVASLVTPVGAGGIAVIEVRGAGAAGLVADLFAPKSGCDWSSEPSSRLHYGHITQDDHVTDEVLVRLVSRGEAGEVIEINCHGGIVTAGEIMRLLVERGASELPPAELAARIAADSRLDRIQHAAMQALPAAETRLAVRMLCDQLNGALSRAIGAIDLEGAEAAGKLRSLCASGEFGMALTRPRRVALIGSPNAGKSTLFNALVGRNRTIVSPVPGTTRDFINELIALGGYPVELVDTAGLRRRGDVVEMKGVEAAWRVVSDADLIVVVMDRSSAGTSEESELLESLLPGAPIAVLNKADLPSARDGQAIPRGLELCEVSALRGDGLAGLGRAVLRRFPDPGDYPPACPVVFSEEQLDLIACAAEHCANRRAGAARRTLEVLIG